MTMWMVRAGEGGSAFERFASERRISVFAGGEIDYLGTEEKALRRRLAEVFSEEEERTLSQHTRKGLNFRHSVKPLSDAVRDALLGGASSL